MYNIIKFFIYSLLRLLLDASLSFSYRNFIITGSDRIKRKKPSVFVSNHQNTFMDGLVLVTATKSINPYILVRADIFKSKWAAKALDIIRLIPIYRKKDNMGSVAQNNKIFKKCFELFRKGKSLLVFPEGNHAVKRFLRPMQKGPSRIAFQAEEEHNFQLGLSVIPFGLHYENHPNPWYDLHLHFGEPFKVSEFKDVFEENPIKAQKQFTDKIEGDISAEMLDIKWHSEYEFMELVRALLKPYAINWAENKKSVVHAESELINRIAKSLKSDETKAVLMKQKITAYFDMINRNKLSDDFMTNRAKGLSFFMKSIGVLIGAPFWLLAKVINFIPEYIIEKKVIGGVKDISWHISLRTGVAMFLYPIYYLLLFTILGFSWDWLLGAIIVFLFPLLSVIMLETEYHFKKLRNTILLLRNQSILKQEQELVREFRALL